jgi:hypothetical protein
VYEVDIGDVRDCCWYASISAVTGIDFDLWNIDYANLPVIFSDFSTHDREHLVAPVVEETRATNLEPWRALLSLNGYELRWLHKKPKGDFIFCFHVYRPRPGDIWASHAVAVEEGSGRIFDITGILDGESVDDVLSDEWCNIVLPKRPFIVIREKK